MPRVSVSVACLVVALSAHAASAQVVETVGIRAQGMGGAFVAVADDATATWWNPAGIATGAFFNALVEYGRLRATPDDRIVGVAVAFPAMGVSYYHLPINQMRAPGPTGTGSDVRQDQGVLSIFGLTVDQSVGDHLVVGSTLKLARAGDSHGDLDLGALARLGVMRLGVTVKNLRKPEFETATGPLTLDRQARAGFALVGHSTGWVSDMTLAVDADLVETSGLAGKTRRVAGGVEAWMFRRLLGLRAGVSGNTVESGSAVSAGASLEALSGKYVKTFVDGQVTRGSEASRRGWGVGLRATF
jgi:hypothetical protein